MSRLLTADVTWVVDWLDMNSVRIPSDSVVPWSSWSYNTHLDAFIRLLLRQEFVRRHGRPLLYPTVLCRAYVRARRPQVPTRNDVGLRVRYSWRGQFHTFIWSHRYMLLIAIRSLRCTPVHSGCRDLLYHWLHFLAAPSSYWCPHERDCLPSRRRYHHDWRWCCRYVSLQSWNICSWWCQYRHHQRCISAKPSNFNQLEPSLRR